MTETLEKVHAFFESDAFRDTPPVDGAVAGVTKLRKMGLRLAIVTARSPSQRQITEEWVSKHFPGAYRWKRGLFKGSCLMTASG
jgi:phosphoglycolate phosphatase-like HAD superfamily hydrolase